MVFMAPMCFAADDGFIISADALLNRAPDETECATAVFANALSTPPENITESSTEADIQQWIYDTFTRSDVLNSVLTCPEIIKTQSDHTIKFMPIEYQFPGGRQIVVNYETQKNVLIQRATLGTKRTLPGGDNPRIGDPNDTAEWANTDPAWYGILVVEHDSLSDFIGPDKNNTVSMKYIEDNIDDIYPHGATCTSKTAIANDNDMINRAVTNAVDLKTQTGEKDTNDYYVAGDKDLRWIGYTEIALDVAITVLTMGTGTAALGATKSTRASRALKSLSGQIKGLTKLDSVRNYMRIANQYDNIADEVKSLSRIADAAKRADKVKEMDNLADAMRNMERADDNIKKYKDAYAAFTDLNKYRRNLRGIMGLKRRGNVLTRGYKGLNAIYSGNKKIKHAAKLGRAGSVANQTRDWLFHTTLLHAGNLAKMETFGGMIYGGIKFIGQTMYDFTETSTGEFTNDIEFKPLGLLSADDIDGGAGDRVNYGMWLMWYGNSTNAADDDAALLKAMDFASKFHQDLTELQDTENNPACNVDIYVVRPVIRNPGTDGAELYWLVMNDMPWTTAE